MCDAGAVVPHADHQPVARLRDRKADGGATMRVEDRVGRQVDDRPLEPQRIDLHQPRSATSTSTLTPRARDSGCQRAPRRRPGRNVRRFLRQAHHTALGMREPCRDPRPAARASASPRAPRQSCSSVSRIHAVEHALEASLDHGQRRPQLMRDVGPAGPCVDGPAPGASSSSR